MSDEYLKKIAEGPVYLLEGNDGMVYGNSQAISKELLRLRECVRELTREAQRADQNGCVLTLSAIYEWSNATLGEPSVADAIAKRVDQ